MVDRQGSKLVEDVKEIKCSRSSNTGNLQCKVVSDKSLPTTYRSIEDVDTEDVEIDNKEMDDGNYSFDEPVQCEVVFGSDLNRIECRS